MTAPPDTGDHQYTGQCVGGPWDGATFSHWAKDAPLMGLTADKSDFAPRGTYTYDPIKALWNWSPA